MCLKGTEMHYGSRFGQIKGEKKSAVPEREPRSTRAQKHAGVQGRVAVGVTSHRSHRSGSEGAGTECSRSSLLLTLMASQCDAGGRLQM